MKPSTLSTVMNLAVLGLLLVLASVCFAEEAGAEPSFDLELGKDESSEDTVDDEDSDSDDEGSMEADISDWENDSDEVFNEGLSVIMQLLAHHASTSSSYRTVYKDVTSTFEAHGFHTQLFRHHKIAGITTKLHQGALNTLLVLRDKIIASIIAGVKLSKKVANNVLKGFKAMANLVKRDVHYVASVVDNWVKIIEAALEKLTPPNIVILGVSGNLGPGVVAAEEVIDFSTQETATFTVKGLNVGGGSIGVGVGAYIGVGWKNSEIKMCIEDAYKGWFGTVAASAQLPFKLASLGGSVSVSMDETGKKLLWNDCVCMAVSGGIGVGFNPLPGSVDVQRTFYKYQGGSSLSDAAMLHKIIFSAAPADPFVSTAMLILKWANKANFDDYVPDKLHASPAS